MGSLWEDLRHMGVPLGSLWRYFGISLRSVWVFVGDLGLFDGYFAMIVESVWSVFTKHTFSTQILMILYSSGVNCGSRWVTFGLIWRMKVTLESLWGHFGITFGM